MFLLLAEMTLFGSVALFWSLFAVWSFFLFWAVEEDWPGRATLSLIAFVLVFHFWGALPGGVSLLAWVTTHAVETVMGIVGFFAMGALWAIAKWWFFVRKTASRYVEARMDFLEGKGIKNVTKSTRVPDELKKSWRQTRLYGRKYRYVNTRFPRLKAKDNKARIMTWMCYWPFSMVWTLINDPVVAAFRAIYDSISGLLQRISDKAFAGIGALEDEEGEGEGYDY